jgi:hypothetical protein
VYIAELLIAQKFELKNNSRILDVCQERDDNKASAKRYGYPTLKTAEGTKLGDRHKEIQSAINSLKRQLRGECLERPIQEFHETIHVAEVDRQLQGI